MVTGRWQVIEEGPSYIPIIISSHNSLTSSPRYTRTCVQHVFCHLLCEACSLVILFLTHHHQKPRLVVRVFPGSPGCAVFPTSFHSLCGAPCERLLPTWFRLPSSFWLMNLNCLSTSRFCDGEKSPTSKSSSRTSCVRLREAESFSDVFGVPVVRWVFGHRVLCQMSFDSCRLLGA